MSIIAQGAEAIVTREGDRVIKDRIEKKYRHPELDERIRTKRTRHEARLLRRAARVCEVPMNVRVEGAKIMMNFVDREPVAENLTPEDCEKIGEVVARLHEVEIVHGDLTTSNILKGPVIIDFGLGESTKRVEDYAMDIHLFKSCLISRHPSIAEECFNAFWKGYEREFPESEEVIQRIKSIETRGRYKIRQ